MCSLKKNWTVGQSMYRILSAYTHFPAQFPLDCGYEWRWAARLDTHVMLNAFIHTSRSRRAEGIPNLTRRILEICKCIQWVESYPAMLLVMAADAWRFLTRDTFLANFKFQYDAAARVHGKRTSSFLGVIILFMNKWKAAAMCKAFDKKFKNFELIND